MKKYMRVFLVLVFVFSLFSINVYNASATTPASEEGCSGGAIYNYLTGERCVASHPQDGCQPGFKYSPLTGARCSDDEDEVPIFPPGCTSSAGYSYLTGQRCFPYPVPVPFPTPPSAVNFSYLQISGVPSKYQFSVSSPKLFDKVVITPDCSESGKIEIVGPVGKERCRAFSASLRPTNGISYSVYLTSKDANVHYADVRADIYYKGSFVGTNTIEVAVYPSVSNSGGPVINGVSGPQTLNVNQLGTWKVSAYNKNGGNLSYSVVWGDEYSYGYGANSNAVKAANISQQSATFTHIYSQAGTYSPTFTVTSPNTIRCVQAPCPSNGGSAQTSLSVNVGNSKNSGYLYISPSSISLGVGENKSVKAYYQPPMPPCPTLTVCAQVMPAPSDVTAYTDWSSSNSNVAKVEYIAPTCIGCKSYPMVRGVSPGTAKITAIYGEVVATNVVFVVGKEVSSITVLSPNGGETFIQGQENKISWSGGNNSVDLGLVLEGATQNTNIAGNPYQIVGWIRTNLKANSPGYIMWDAKKVCGGGNVCWNVSPGSYKIIAITEDKVGNKLIWDSIANKQGAWDLSDSYFKITSDTPTSTNLIKIRPANKQKNYEPGQIDVTLAEFNFTALDSGTKATFSDLGFWGFMADSQGNYYTSSPTYPTHFKNFTLWVNGIKHSYAEASSMGDISFSGKSEFLVSYGSPVKVSLKANVAAGMSAATYRFALTGYGTDGIYDIDYLDSSGMVFTGADSEIKIKGSTSNCSSSGYDTQTGFRCGCTSTSGYSATNGMSCKISDDGNGRNQVFGAETFAFTERLQRGSEGNEVIELQKFLVEAGYDVGSVDGKFGLKTQAAVSQLQTKNNLKVDGIVGTEVRLLLNR
ncbi:MAG: peptidoglycan-binding domain-containing protein [Minisyncoccia bacterium]